MQTIQLEPNIFLIPNFLDHAECQRFIDASEVRGFEQAKIDVGGPQVMAKDVRNNDRLFWEDESLARSWFERAQSVLTPIQGDWQPIGLNERFRFYRYKGGHKFVAHRDGNYKRGPQEMSWYTFMVYLNDGYQGGRTRFDLANYPEPLSVEGKTGTALLFHHHLLHEVEEVFAGTKYVLRTDVMYRKGQGKT